MRFLRRSRNRGNTPTAEQLFDEALGIKPGQPGPDHPVWNAEARQEIARDASGRLLDRCDALRASGRWTPSLEAAWNDLSKAELDDPQNEDRVRRLARLVTEAETGE